MSTTTEKLTSLNAAAADAPEYAEIVPLFIGLYGYLNGRETETGIRITLAGVNFNERLGNGFPLLSPQEMSVDQHLASQFLGGVIAELAKGGREGHSELGKVQAALNEQRLDLPQLFPAVLERRRAPLDEAAVAVDVPGPLLEYLLEIPLRTALELSAAGIGSGTFAQWDAGNCPFCGSRAGMAELVGEEGQRFLSCATCATCWSFKRLKCPYCGTEDGEKLTYFTADDGPCRVDLCTACSRYIKTRDARKGNGHVPLEIEDLLTIHLDLLAVREGYERGK